MPMDGWMIDVTFLFALGLLAKESWNRHKAISHNTFFYSQKLHYGSQLCIVGGCVIYLAKVHQINTYMINILSLFKLKVLFRIYKQ